MLFTDLIFHLERDTCHPWMWPRVLSIPCRVSNPPGTCSLSLQAGGVPGTPGLRDFKEHGMLERRGISVAGSDLPVPASAFITPSHVSGDPSGVQGFETPEVWRWRIE
jgi:hypothetical protein